MKKTAMRYIEGDDGLDSRHMTGPSHGSPGLLALDKLAKGVSLSIDAGGVRLDTLHVGNGRCGHPE